MDTRRAAEPETVPIACTLDAGDRRGRLEEWQAVLDQATSRTAGADGALRVEFAPDLALGVLASLVAAEQRCCAFFSFAITVDQRGIGLEVSAPEGSEEAVVALFGPAPLKAGDDGPSSPSPVAGRPST